MGRYHIVGRAGAGSLIAEFLFREVGVDYDISFPDPVEVCLLYTSPSPRDTERSRMPSSA